MDDQEIQEFVRDRRGSRKYIKGQDLDETCLSMLQFESYMTKFFKDAKFPLKPQDKSIGGISEKHINAFVISINNQKWEVDFHAKDSCLSSSKIITCCNRIRDDPTTISGIMGLGLIKKYEKDYHENLWDDLENKKKKPHSHNRGKLDDPALYTKKKEWGWQIGEDSKKYEITSKGDLTILRDKVIAEFMENYIYELKQY
ncbi:MAG: hypothetical protein KKE23_00245 [Nanoarchaeota archaeon]|nr:hypothetical protein [Nanoarchaeota archaeon]